LSNNEAIKCTHHLNNYPLYLSVEAKTHFQLCCSCPSCCEITWSGEYCTVSTIHLNSSLWDSSYRVYYVLLLLLLSLLESCSSASLLLLLLLSSSWSSSSTTTS
jgi:hypothetical protein